MTSSESPATETPCEQALSDVRDALAGLQSIPVAGLDPKKAETVLDVVETVTALEQQLANEVDQQTDDRGDVGSYLPAEVTES